MPDESAGTMRVSEAEVALYVALDHTRYLLDYVLGVRQLGYPPTMSACEKAAEGELHRLIEEYLDQTRHACGHWTIASANYCQNCGQPLKADAPTVVPQVPQ
jgi:hypothetical protein